MSSLEELLATAVRHFEEGRTVVDGLPCFRSQTGEEYTVITSNGVKRETDPWGTGHKSSAHAVLAWLHAILKWSQGKKGTIYWRDRPHFCELRDCSGIRITSRLLISEKPIIYGSVEDALSNRQLDDPAYSYRWANADKLSDTVTAGWTLVTPLQERKVGTTQFGTPLYAYRYRIPKEKLAARQAKCAEVALGQCIDQAAGVLSPEAQRGFRSIWRDQRDMWRVNGMSSAGYCLPGVDYSQRDALLTD